jgi:hypothetical protein
MRWKVYAAGKLRILEARPGKHPKIRIFYTYVIILIVYSPKKLVNS